MEIEQIYTGCLAQGAYYIESGGEALVIDPLRETSAYINRATATGAKIKYVLETHFHADFVSGHLDLAKETGATIVFGPGATTAFAAHIATDGEMLKLGNVKIQVLHTPGHTPESTCYLLYNAENKPVALFSGDTLFIGDVGRPDLAVKSDLGKEDLAGMLFDSLRNKIMPLADDIVVYPAHGAGSACGKNMSKETYDTLGNQKKVNYALNLALSREAFIQEVTSGLSAAPYYFPENAKLNKLGYESFETVSNRALVGLPADAFEAVANATAALLLDTRDAELFAKGFVPNSINIGIDGSFAPWVGALITNIKQPLLLITAEGREEETITRLARVGYDQVLGFLAGGIAAWKAANKEIDTIQRVSAQELEQLLLQEAQIPVFDVRKRAEYLSEHLVIAENIPLDELNTQLASIPKNERVLIHCAGGYRSMIAASILKARGWEQIVDVRGGFKALAETKIAKTDYICPSKIV